MIRIICVQGSGCMYAKGHLHIVVGVLYSLVIMVNFHRLKRLNFLPTFSNALGISEFEGGDMVIGRYWFTSGSGMVGVGPQSALSLLLERLLSFEPPSDIALGRRRQTGTLIGGAASSNLTLVAGVRFVRPRIR